MARTDAKFHLDKLNNEWEGMNRAQVEFHATIFDANMRYAEFVQAELDSDPTVIALREMDQ